MMRIEIDPRRLGYTPFVYAPDSPGYQDARPRYSVDVPLECLLPGAAAMLHIKEHHRLEGVKYVTASSFQRPEVCLDDWAYALQRLDEMRVRNLSPDTWLMGHWLGVDCKLVELHGSVAQKAGLTHILTLRGVTVGRPLT